jgi:preprotein translocase subunit SecF
MKMMKNKNNGNNDKLGKSLYKKSYKFLMIIPIVLILCSIFIIIQTSIHEGVPIYRDVSLKGGVSAIININTQISLNDFKQKLEELYSQNSFSVSELYIKGVRSGFVIDTDLEDNMLRNSLNGIFDVEFIDGENYNSNVISPSLSSAFFSQAIKILMVSFILMSIVIFLYFKEFVPSFAVVLSGLFDIIVTIGILDFFNVKISIAGIGALLMLIGYSIDTDVLLTNRLIKEKGDNYFEKTFDAFKTGLLMSITTLFAGFIAIFVTNSNVIYQISLILVIGLLVDMISTWLQNTGILLWWLENKNN